MKTKSLRNTFLLTAASGLIVGLSTVAPSSAAVIFSENFDGVTVGSAIVPGNTNYTLGATGAGTTQTSTLDSANLFGLGTSNRYNLTNDGSTSFSTFIGVSALNGSGLGSIATYSWDFNDSTGREGYTFRISTGNSPQSAHTTQVNFNSSGAGSILDVTSAFTLGSTYRVDLVANVGASTVNFSDGNGIARSVGASRFSVFLTTLDRTTQTVIKDNATFNGGAGAADGLFRSVAFQTFNGNTPIVAWDNVTVRDEAFVTTAVPEPSTYALFCVAGVAAIAMVRRRRQMQA